ncbi:hypothetical protein [Ligilactobacillus acidipiscis]|uniref:hypothetical protein n=1 Tax=Ligilactobacillus acidipiscis TaxID=89059 RepID=UPI0023F9E7A4|nr:hypothetical protein [Ligilactobacillus acidipiscis]WEV56425.1 hypothetical protein OZX66_09355 [Ligilactobacillus acidipiscis]
MVKTGVRLSDWESDVNTAQDSIDEIKKLKGLGLKKTSLAPFKQLKEIGQTFNDSIESFQSFGKKDLSKMIQAGQNKKTDDEQGMHKGGVK